MATAALNSPPSMQHPTHQLLQSRSSEKLKGHICNPKASPCHSLIRDPKLLSGIHSAPGLWSASAPRAPHEWDSGVHVRMRS